VAPYGITERSVRIRTTFLVDEARHGHRLNDEAADGHEIRNNVNVGSQANQSTANSGCNQHWRQSKGETHSRRIRQAGDARQPYRAWLTPLPRQSKTTSSPDDV
jgi:hypothetical protein